MTDSRLPKSEIMRGDIAVAKLFAEGRGGYCHPCRYVFRTREGEGVRVLFSVPKKNFKRAVRRNLLKRRMRETYRLNKSGLYTSAAGSGRAVDIAIVYSSKDVCDYKTIENGIKRILAEIGKRL